MHILFVCSGNTCRSPMAEALAKAIAKDLGLPHTFDSAGVYATPGMDASDLAKEVMRTRYNLDLSQHKSKPLTRELIDAADLALCMTKEHERAVKARFPNDKTLTLGAFSGKEQDVADPYGGSLSNYLACAQQMENLLSIGIQDSKQ